MQNQCAEIKLRAERKGGELLKGMKDRGERIGQHGGDRSDSVSLQDLGVSNKQSSRWQTITSIPEADFERHIEEAKGSRRRLHIVQRKQNH